MCIGYTCISTCIYRLYLYVRYYYLAIRYHDVYDDQ